MRYAIQCLDAAREPSGERRATINEPSLGHRVVGSRLSLSDEYVVAPLAEELMAGGVGVLTGGTDVHLVLVDLTSTGLDGRTAEGRLEEVGITVNRNAIPFDERPPMNPSGLRI